MRKTSHVLKVASNLQLSSDSIFPMNRCEKLFRHTRGCCGVLACEFSIEPVNQSRPSIISNCNISVCNISHTFRKITIRRERHAPLPSRSRCDVRMIARMTLREANARALRRSPHSNQTTHRALPLHRWFFSQNVSFHSVKYFYVKPYSVHLKAISVCSYLYMRTLSYKFISALKFRSMIRVEL